MTCRASVAGWAMKQVVNLIQLKCAADDIIASDFKDA